MWRRRYWTVASFALLLGVSVGVAAKLADGLSVEGAGEAATSPTLWIGVIAAIARLAPSPAEAAMRSALFFIGLCVGYYAWTSVVLGYPGSGPLLLAWIGLACTLAPGGAWVVGWARRGSGWGPAAIIVGTAGFAASDPRLAQVWYRITGDLPADFPLRPSQAALAIIVVAMIIVWLPANGTTRWRATILLVPATLVARWLVESFGAFPTVG